MRSMSDPAVEAFARVWAGIDGKLDGFDRCKKSVDLDRTEGYYSGYLAEAQEFLRRLEQRGYTVTKML